MTLPRFLHLAYSAKLILAAWFILLPEVELMSIEIVQEPGFVRYTVTGAWASREASLHARDAVRALHVWQPGGRLLVDITRVEVGTVPSYVQGLRGRLVDWLDLGPPPKIAVVATEGVRFGLGRVIEQFFSQTDSQTFLDEASALAWLVAADEGQVAGRVRPG